MDDDDDEKKLLPHNQEKEDVYGTLLFSVLDLTKLPKELQIIIAGYVDFTTADYYYAGFYVFTTKIQKMMCAPDNISIVVNACGASTYTLHVPLASVLKPQDAPLSNQELSELFLRSKKSFHMVQLNQMLSDETHSHIQTTVLPFVQQRASLRFPLGYTVGASIQDSKRTLDTHRSLNCLCLLLVTLLCLASSAAIGYFLYMWIGPESLFPLFVAVLCVMCLCLLVFACCVSLQQGWDDTTIKQTWVWAIEENEDFRETLKEVVAQAQLKR